jgi:hypothetical protein
MGDRLQPFARNRDGLIAELTTILLPSGPRDLAIDKPNLEQVTAALTTTTTTTTESDP